MTNDKLLRAIGDIDDRFVEEADAAQTDNAGGVSEANTKTVSVKPRSSRRPLKIAAAACAAVLIFTAGFFGGAGSIGARSNAGKNYAGEPDVGHDVYSTQDTSYQGWNNVIEYEQKAGIQNAGKPDAAAADNNGGNVFAGDPAGNAGSTGGVPAELKNTKLIYSASVSLQSTEFEKTCGYIKSLADRYFGFIENETVDNGNGSAAYRRSASYTVRVPAENYNSFLSGMSEECHVVSLNQNMTDVSERYFDTEQKLQTLRTKHDRLEALLEKAEKMEDILRLEDALSENEYEINQYQGSLNKYDSLVSYSTIKIALKEVSRPDTGIDEQPGFFQRLGRSFAEGFSNTLSGLENIVYWLSYNLIVLIILAVIIIALVKIHPIRRIKEARARKKG